jgi:hypothetical protein
MTTYQSDQARVVYETIDGETLIIDLFTGTYYSLKGSGPAIWELLVAGSDIEATAAELARRHPAQGSREIRDAIDMLTADLLDAKLLEERSNALGAPPRSAALPAESGAFDPPTFESYTDMEYFLLLDPIHEVDPAEGWPHEQQMLGHGQ